MRWVSQSITGRPARKTDRLAVLLLVLVPCLVFSNTLNNSYHLDDFGRIAENPEIDQVFPLHRHFLDPRTSSSIPTIVQYRPLLPLSLSINAALGEAVGLERLTAFHIGNILIHVLSSLLLYFLLRELLAHWSGAHLLIRRQGEAAFIAALLFALHPVSGVPVNYLAARDLLLMQFFLLACLLTYLRMRRQGESIFGWAAVLLLLALSLLSKTNAVAAPLVVLFFELLLGGGRLTSLRMWRRVLPLAALTGGFFLFTKLALGFSDVGMLMVERQPLEYPLSQAKVHLFYYLRNFWWPFYMRPLAQIEPVQTWMDLKACCGAVLILGSLAAAWKLRVKVPLASFSIMAYWMLFSPTSSLLPFRMLAADYRQYPSLPFLCLALSLAILMLVRPRYRWAVSAAFLTYFAMSSFLMNQVWKSEESLWEHSVRHGASSIAHHNYAHSQSGKNDELAEKHYREALRLTPTNIWSHIGLGMLHIRQGQSEEGLAQVRRATELSPDWAVTHYWLSRALTKVGSKEEAAQESRRAWQLDPRSLLYAYQVAQDARAVQDYAASLKALQRLHAQRASYRESLFLEGFALQMLGRNQEAIASYRTFLQEQPKHVQTRFNLAYALMKESQYREAVQEFQQTLQLRPSYREVHLHLSTCFRALGNYPMADRHSKEYQAGN